MSDSKFLFFDLDGTLNVSGERIRDDIVSALLDVQHNGHKIFISTGRLQSSIPDYTRSIPFNGGIYSAGRHLVADGITIVESFMDSIVVEEIEKRMQNFPIKQSIETNIGVYVDGYDKQCGVTIEDWYRLINIIGGTSQYNIEEYKYKYTYKIVFITNTINDVNAIVEMVSEINRLFSIQLETVVFGKMIPDIPFIIGEINDSSVNKGTGLLNICKYYGVDPNCTIAFGDSMNDASIINQAGIGVAMANSDKHLMDIADIVCGSVESDGIISGLRQLGLL